MSLYSGTGYWISGLSEVLLDIVFIHVVRGRPGGLLQLFKGKLLFFLAFVSSGIRAL